MPAAHQVHYESNSRQSHLDAWFPLIPRPRPACASLQDRIDDITTLTSSPHPKLSTLTGALNKAALIASDCGIPSLARYLCWRQYEVFARHAPLNATISEAAMEPIINLGRLAIRDGNGDGAYQIFQQLFDAVSGPVTAELEGGTVDFPTLVPEPDTRRQLRKALWATLLSDGTRALTRAGQWQRALDHAQQYNGIGDRLMDGRQVAIIARYEAEDFHGAAYLAEQTHAPTPWERAVTAYLRVLCLDAGGAAESTDVLNVIDAYFHLDPQADQIVFRTRLGLCVLDLAWSAGVATAPVAVQVITDTLTFHDAYAAHDLLNHVGCQAHLTSEQTGELTEVVTSSGLRQRTISEQMRRQLTTAVHTAHVHLEQIVRS